MPSHLIPGLRHIRETKAAATAQGEKKTLINLRRSWRPRAHMIGLFVAGMPAIYSAPIRLQQEAR